MSKDSSRPSGHAGAPGHADRDAGGAVDEVVRQLSERIDLLERELQALRNELEALGAKAAPRAGA